MRLADRSKNLKLTQISPIPDAAELCLSECRISKSEEDLGDKAFSNEHIIPRSRWADNENSNRTLMPRSPVEPHSWQDSSQIFVCRGIWSAVGRSVFGDDDD